MPQLRTEEAQRSNINDTSADTEFNDALIARGIIPARPVAPEEPDIPLPTHLDIVHAVGSTTSNPQTLQTLADDTLDSDDEKLFLQYKAQRIKEVKEQEARVGRVMGGSTRDGMREIGREEFVREVTEGSKRSLEAEGVEKDEDEEDEDDDLEYGLPESERKVKPKSKGTGVVCFLYQNHIPLSNHLRDLLTALCPHHPLTRFLSIRSTTCIPSYPDKNTPTLLLYRSGSCLHQILAPSISLSWTPKDLEDRLVHFGVLDGPAQTLKRVGGAKGRREREEEEEEDEEDWEFGTIERGRKGEGRGIRTGGKGKGLGEDEDDSDFDL